MTNIKVRKERKQTYVRLIDVGMKNACGKSNWGRSVRVLRRQFDANSPHSAFIRTLGYVKGVVWISANWEVCVVLGTKQWKFQIRRNFKKAKKGTIQTHSRWDPWVAHGRHSEYPLLVSQDSLSSFWGFEHKNKVTSEIKQSVGGEFCVPPNSLPTNCCLPRKEGIKCAAKFDPPLDHWPQFSYSFIMSTSLLFDGVDIVTRWGKLNGVRAWIPICFEASKKLDNWIRGGRVSRKMTTHSVLIST